MIEDIYGIIAGELDYCPPCPNCGGETAEDWVCENLECNQDPDLKIFSQNV